jgi:hypothetical protein
MQGPWDSKVDIWTFDCLVSRILHCFLRVLIPSCSGFRSTTSCSVYRSSRTSMLRWRRMIIIWLIKFTGEEFPPDLIKTYKLAPQFLNMQTGESVLYICCDNRSLVNITDRHHLSTRLPSGLSANLLLLSTSLCSSETIPWCLGFLSTISLVQSASFLVDPANRPSAIQLVGYGAILDHMTILA